MSERFAVTAREAMSLLGVNNRQHFEKIARDPANADIFPKPFNLKPKGDKYYSVESIKKFILEREKRGIE